MDVANLPSHVHSISIKLEGFKVRLLSEWTQQILSGTILLNRRLNSNITIIPQHSQNQVGLPDVCNWFSVHGLAIEVAHNVWWSACGQFSTTGADLIFVCTISILVIGIYRENSLRKIDCLSFSENDFIEENAALDRNWQKYSITLVAVVFRPLVAVGPREKTDHSIAVPRAYHQWPDHLWFDIDIAWDPNFIDFHHSFILISCELPYETVIWY